MIPDAEGIDEKGKIIYVKISQKNRSKVIGKAGKNVKIINKLLQRLFDVEELKVR
jgi:transcription antitermination factor NusA-like protein